ncbi:uncharacterized protein ARMOST_04314 [Armillaria ostoyae]|uniref:Uncharacterized protein n=1 Tax=Armillaria ostoyae TaxID=47428 RepID=A0A284QX01_ARMOS|nr:uncharacterized protein ARMOST_04314 [Armillaria ostoyae]
MSETGYPPPPLDHPKEASIMRECVDSMQPSVSQEAGSTVCGQLTPLSKLSQSRHVARFFSILENDACTSKEQTAFDKCLTPLSAYITPAGCKWSNNSCAYNTVLFVLYNLWRPDDVQYTAVFGLLCNQWLDMAMTSFKRHSNGKYTLEEVRDYLRRALHREYPALFMFGGNTSVKALMMRLLWTSDTFSSDDYHCRCGQVTPISMQECCIVIPHSTTPLG